jgi:hypothetical protein
MCWIAHTEEAGDGEGGYVGRVGQDSLPCRIGIKGKFLLTGDSMPSPDQDNIITGYHSFEAGPG